MEPPGWAGREYIMAPLKLSFPSSVARWMPNLFPDRT